MFALGTVDPLLVDKFSGFDLPPRAQLVTLISDGVSPGPDQVVQSSGTPFRTATITGTITEAVDLATLRGYDVTIEEITFVDGSGNETPVRIVGLQVEDLTDWWTFGATIIATGDTVPPGS